MALAEPLVLGLPSRGTTVERTGPRPRSSRDPRNCSEPERASASSSAVESPRVASRQSPISSSPSKAPTWVWVLPTSTASSIGAIVATAAGPIACRFAPMKARLFTIPASHPGWTVRLMLERKGIPYTRIDLVKIVSMPVVRALGFPGSTVPALIFDGKGSRARGQIARELDALVPSRRSSRPTRPSASGSRRRSVGRRGAPGAIARRLAWNLLARTAARSGAISRASRLGVPHRGGGEDRAPDRAALGPLQRADDADAIADLAALPGLIDRVDGYDRRRRHRRRSAERGRLPDRAEHRAC